MDHSFKKKLFEKRKINSRYETGKKELLNICKRDVQLTKKLLLFWTYRNKNRFKLEARMAFSSIINLRRMDKIPIYKEWKSYFRMKYNEQWKSPYNRFRIWEIKRNWEEINCTMHFINPIECIYCKKGLLIPMELKNLSLEKIKKISTDTWGYTLKSRLARMQYNDFVRYKNGSWRPVCCSSCNKITLNDLKYKTFFSK